MSELTNKRRWVLVPCPDYDVPAMESWLEEQAARGWFLSEEDGFFLGFACFESGAPQHVRYRLDAMPEEKILSAFPENKQSAIELAQELGWEFVTERKEFLIYRCMDESAPELNTDPAVQALSLKRVQSALSSRIWYACYILFLYPILNLSLRFPAVLLSVLTLGTLRFLGILAITVIQTAAAFHAWRKLKKLRAHLKAGGRIVHTDGWHDEAKRCIAGKIAGPILTAVWLALILSFVAAPKSGAPVTDESRLPVPTLSSILQLSKALTDDRDTLTLRESHDLLAPTIDTMHQNFGGYICDTTYYEMRTPLLAGWLAKDLRRYDERSFFGKRAYEITEVPLPSLDADTAYSYLAHHFGYRIIVRKGTKLVSACIWWWPSDDAFPAETVARALLESIS